MSYATKFNKSGNKFTFRQGENVNYLSLEELYNMSENKIYPVKALYINKKSMYGDAPCIVISEDTTVNLPKHLLDTVIDMINDEECVYAINHYEVKFKIYSYKDKAFNRTCYSVEWL